VEGTVRSRRNRQTLRHLRARNQQAWIPVTTSAVKPQRPGPRTAVTSGQVIRGVSPTQASRLGVIAGSRPIFRSVARSNGYRTTGCEAATVTK
jgi:hypothetical protein